ncbi:transporter substrate-binding domain-containing protein [Thalassotalea profundi]|uniref:Solute-binding protein family 3/N-terminal domain-containing protein n=1 Tax=Thalassotalea profundi TaxID=2036687 RepID=A0ABQ3IHV4_9GAMM|nr:transporter substrate-binding domain-containing protein [Thalassotalea profundi]GHE81894.1 hypothetical protein GCM10011501_07830 [Thalassotalea profundi]
MKIFIFLLLFPIFSFAESISVALYANHDNHIKYSRSYNLTWQLFQLAAKNEGITLKTKQYLWLRALNAIEKKQLDMLIAGYYTHERERFSVFSQPLSFDNLYLYSFQPESLPLEEINKEHKIIGTTTKSVADGLAKSIGFNSIYQKSSSEELFDLLVKQKLDYAIFTESLANTYCTVRAKKILNKNCIFAVQPPLVTKTIHTIYNQTPRMISIAKRIDSAIEKLISTGKVKQLFLDVGYNEKEYINWLEERDKWINKST